MRRVTKRPYRVYYIIFLNMNGSSRWVKRNFVVRYKGELALGKAKKLCTIPDTEVIEVRPILCH